jgi:hypothetical protein
MTCDALGCVGGTVFVPQWTPSSASCRAGLPRSAEPSCLGHSWSDPCSGRDSTSPLDTGLPLFTHSLKAPAVAVTAAPVLNPERGLPRLRRDRTDCAAAPQPVPSDLACQPAKDRGLPGSEFRSCCWRLGQSRRGRESLCVASAPLADIDMIVTTCQNRFRSRMPSSLPSLSGDLPPTTLVPEGVDVRSTSP